jgi:hypothetical protein
MSRGKSGLFDCEPHGGYVVSYRSVCVTAHVRRCPLSSVTTT